MNKDKCRVCLEKGLKMINIFQESFLNISTKIMSLAKVQIYSEDGMPNTMCRKCLKKLDCCIEFIQLCQDSDLKLRALLAKTGKLVESHVNSYIDVEFQNDSSNDEMCKYSPEKDYSSIENKTQSLFSNETRITRDIDKSLVNDTFCVTKTNYAKKIEKQQCFTCGKVMSSKFRLQTHLRTHTGERPFSCPHCSKNFALAQSLKVHLRTHTGEKPLSCSDCDATFAHSAGLAAHKRKHTGQTPYRCVLCPRSFRTIGHLQYHIRRHTGEKNFECDTCGRAFITRSDLKKHLQSHTGDKPHVCCICGLRLTRASHLKRHIQFIHNGDKPFACTQCPSKFSQKASLEKHKRKHGTEEKT